MGSYLNPGSERFRTSLRSEIYVDKSMLIAQVNRRIRTEQKFICVSRPRRFGKSMAAEMLAAYYGSGEDTLFINNFRKKGKVFLCCENIGMVDFSSSTWFKGYDEKYFFDQGAKIAAMGSYFKWFAFLYYALRIPTDRVSFVRKVELMKVGFRNYKML